MGWIGERRENATVTVRRIFTKANIDTKHELGEDVGKEFQRLNDRGRFVIGSAATRILEYKAYQTQPFCTVTPKSKMQLAFSIVTGTPKRITLFKPFSTKGFKNASSLLIPHRFCPGKVATSCSASGSSEMKMG